MAGGVEPRHPIDTPAYVMNVKMSTWALREILNIMIKSYVFYLEVSLSKHNEGTLYKGFEWMSERRAFL